MAAVSVIAWAQPAPRTESSLDAAVMNAKNVFVGQIEAVHSDGGPISRVDFKVESTEKGPEMAHQTVDSNYSPSYLEDIGKNGTRFLVISPNQTKRGPALLLNLTGDDPVVPTADLRLLHGAPEIIAYAKRCASLPEGENYVLSLQYALMAVERSENSMRIEGQPISYLIVPVDNRLQETARKMIQSKNPTAREHGATALGKFKSGENIALLKALLLDPHSYAQPNAKGNAGIDVLHFPVRIAANGSLTAWGVKGTPVLTEEKPRFDTVTEIYLYSQRVTDKQFDQLIQCTKLKELDLARVVISDSQMEKIAQIKSLKSLNIAGGTFSDKSLASLAKLPQLRFLSLVLAPVTDLAIENVAKITSLTDLKLSAKDVDTDRVRALQKLRPNLNIISM